MELELTPAGQPHADKVRAGLQRAVDNLELGERLAALHLIVDDLAGDGRGWLRLDAEGRVELYCHPGQFMTPDPAIDAMMPVAQPWEIRDRSPEVAPYVFSRRHCDRFLHHQLLALRDLLDRRVEPRKVPHLLSEAFQEVWDVSIDGRLRRNSLPGQTVAERRRVFYRRFAGGGVLMPLHWEVFHAAWDGDSPTTTDLLEWAGALPPLR